MHDKQLIIVLCDEYFIDFRNTKITNIQALTLRERTQRVNQIV